MDKRGRVVMFTHDQQIDRRILLEADSLEADGWVVDIFALGVPGCIKDDDRRVVRVGIGEGRAVGRFHGLLLAGYGLLRRWVPVNSPLMRFARSVAWSLVWGGPGALFVTVFSQAIADQRADVYVAHDLPMLPVAVAAVERHGGRLIYDSHECFPEQEFNALERRMWRILEADLIGRCDRVVTVNAHIARFLERRYGLRKVEVIVNAERPLEGHPTGGLDLRRALPQGARVVLFQGGLSEGRNLDVLVRMVPLLRLADVHVLILGDGLLRDRLAALARRLRVESRVHFFPAVPQSELLAVTASADVGIIPYLPTCLNNLYCTPNKLFEFIAAGLPVIASDLPELRWFVETYGIGVVGDCSAPAAVARMVDDFFISPGAVSGYKEASENARRLVSWDVEGQRLVELYRTLGPESGRFSDSSG